MTVLLERIETVDQTAARAELRRQVTKLERELASYEPTHTGGARAPRLPTLAALERTRDDLLDALGRARTAERERERSEADARRRLQALIEDPARHRRERITLAELGEGGCGAYTVRPRLGLLGRLRGWWVVKLSSGCPLEAQHRADALVRPQLGVVVGIDIDDVRVLLDGGLDELVEAVE
jgi:hypothetical protein